ncbi:MAG: ATP-dependent DNA helicase [Legionella sp.]|nr:ATP-dependent DNA helicase [Legionella sp.]
MNKNSISLSVVDFALPSPLVGSIDTYSGLGNRSTLAMKVHQDIQSTKKQAHPEYIFEVQIQHAFTYKGMVFNISGRMDGLYKQAISRIEEIKTAFDCQSLISKLGNGYFTHPYWLQIQMYGYMHWLNTKESPNLNLLIVALGDKKSTSLPITFDVKAIELWLNKRLEDLYQEVKHSKQRMAHRKKESTKLLFPFDTPRPFQADLIASVTQHLSNKHPMLIQAPTGLGKSVGILFPVLKDALKRGQKTIYVTPKNSQHQIALNTLQQFQRKGSACKSLVLTSKKKLCMKNEPLCNARYCEFAEDHYTKCTSHNLTSKLRQHQNLDFALFKKMATDYKVCPYELQIDSIALVDVVVADYNYVFSPSSMGSKVVLPALGEKGKPSLVIDEAHNVPQRSMDYYSPSLESSFFWNIQAANQKFPHRFQQKFNKIISQCLDVIDSCATPQSTANHILTPSLTVFKAQEQKLYEFLISYLESEVVIELEDPILKMYHYWADFTSILECVQELDEGFFIFFNPATRSIKMSCCDASSFLKEHYKNFQQVIGFSATLKPFVYYSQLMGLHSPKLHTEEFASPFPASKRKLLIIPQVSTKYSQRPANYPKIVDVIMRTARLNPGNYFVFFPSFDFLNTVYALFLSLSEPQFTLLRQQKNMLQTEVNTYLERLKQTDRAHLFFAVQGGIFAEGIDYIGNLAIGAFIVGPPLPMYDWEREQKRLYYEQHYKEGQQYAYIYPAMAKAVQAAGRVIRSETDKGIIILMDNRFLQQEYSHCMPVDWFEYKPHELVSTSILKDLRLFWESTEATDI